MEDMHTHVGVEHASTRVQRQAESGSAVRRLVGVLLHDHVGHRLVGVVEKLGVLVLGVVDLVDVLHTWQQRMYENTRDELCNKCQPHGFIRCLSSPVRTSEHIRLAGIRTLMSCLENFHCSNIIE